MNSGEIRQRFFSYFEDKGHKIVPSAPIVNKNDPTLLFTNAGMNQFKDYFLGTKKIENTRVADTQKCLRVSGKHNDLEEVGVDGYHHTMFEMLGNWSFGDYFKEEIIDWSFDLLTEVYGLPQERLYATVFEGDQGDGLTKDQEAEDLWKKYLPEDRILEGSKKDNFWEMGDTGPCGPCSEIHIDLRSDADIDKLPGRELINKDHPLVVELWNLVFIQFNRLSDGSLQSLDKNHVDTGMGFERLCMAIQGKTSNYETDVFTGLLDKIGSITRHQYHNSYEADAKVDMTFRVVADHLRAVAFTIMDGQIPGNSGAGYVIRRILRRAVRYYYTFLDWKEPLLHQLVGTLATQFEAVFPEMKAQETFITKVIYEEEKSFLRTLAEGIQRFHLLEAKNNMIQGEDAFLLYDTYGFPIDLTQLMAREMKLDVDIAGFKEELEKQKKRSRQDAAQKVGDWTIVRETDRDPVFLGYDQTEVQEAHILRYRTIEKKKSTIHQIVLDQTPFYAEGGGQIGDTGLIQMQDGERLLVLDTVRENDLIVHLTDRLPNDPAQNLTGHVDHDRRHRIALNHSATHLLHAALRQVLGKHVQQKGSLVAETHLRFDFSHYEKISEEQLSEVERIVNEKISQNIPLQEDRSMALDEARKAGAMMLFGEKYGETVRMITFDPDYSRELCGGIHVNRTSEIRLFKITSESSVAAGIRRVEARTGTAAVQFLEDQVNELNAIRRLFRSTGNIKGQIEKLLSENASLTADLMAFQQEQNQNLRQKLTDKAIRQDDYALVAEEVEDLDGDQLKNLVYELGDKLAPAVIVIGNRQKEKAQLMVYIDKTLTDIFDFHAGKLIRDAAPLISGGGGGQPFFATAGGKNPDGLHDAVERIVRAIETATNTKK
ncbi:alanine--tRNA ligase [Membranicola marinus]|uniref:Alanine--tRNA ligase n=1 Tax=Membranihabitans marinus TaxID=1227546 RepID=A0A953HTC4_9BACT|nr:alanine--tRNA ligase [Membranihabitans marinus]MBY5957861.1 alanine--tRNA ligase [Membranihabitans marinus]